MKSAYSFFSAFALVSISFGSLSAFADEPWRTVMSCEGGEARLESQKTGPYTNRYQVIIDTTLPAFKKLAREGGINDNSYNHNREEWVLGALESVHAHWAYRGYSARDNGTLVYSIVPAYENRKLIVNVAWTDGDIHAAFIPGFTGAEFYDCRY